VWPFETPQVVDACATPEPMVIIEASKASITKKRTMKRRVPGFCTGHLSRFDDQRRATVLPPSISVGSGVAPSNDNSVIVGSEVEKDPPTNE
jgi:hypothetical protein